MRSSPIYPHTIPGVQCTAPSDANAVARKILQTGSKPFRLDEHERYVTTSIGISFYPTDGQEEDTLIKAADSAMYRAKQSGRNSFHFFNDEIHVQ